MKIKNKKALNIFLGIFGFIMIVITLYVIRVLSLSTPTKGTVIREYNDPKAALIVIDMQNDTTKNSSLYGDTTSFIDKVNKSIDIAEKKDMEIVYIKQECKSNPLDMLISLGKYRAGTEGLELDSRLKIVNDKVFTKNKSDAFSLKNFENYLASKQINTIYLVGADATACVYKTALGGINRKYKVIIVEDSIITVNYEIQKKMLKQYSSDGIIVTTLEQFDKINK